MFALFVVVRIAIPLSLAWAGYHWGWPYLSATSEVSITLVSSGIVSLVASAIAATFQNFSRDEAKEVRDAAGTLSRPRRDWHVARAVRAQRKSEAMMAYVASSAVLAAFVVSGTTILSNVVQFWLASVSLVASFIGVADAVDGRKATRRAQAGIKSLQLLEVEHRAAKQWLQGSLRIENSVEPTVMGIVTDGKFEPTHRA